MVSIEKYLQGAPYPGRGILFGKSADGMHLIASYFITGRSENSQNRILENFEHGIRTQPYDACKIEDPSLIFYTPVRTYKKTLILSNGDHTDTIYQALACGSTFHEALLSRTYEPDVHHTPRISGLLEQETYQLSTLYKAKSSMDCMRVFYHYGALQNGTGHLLHTYDGCESQLRPFHGPPVEAALPQADITTFTETLWTSLSASYRVALFTQYTPVNGGAPIRELRNRHTKEQGI